MYFTSESVGEGHPDKVADQISDAVLDECLRQDPESHVACETFTTTGLVLVGGELKTKANINVQKIVRGVLTDIGYTDPSYGIDGNSCAVINTLHEQSPDIDMGVSKVGGEVGAGDQGLMFGYANKDNEAYLPMPIYLAHDLMRTTKKYREDNWVFGPDGKCQITVEYRNKKPVRVDKIVFSQQHGVGYSSEIVQLELRNIIRKSQVDSWIDDHTQIYLNPTGRFIIGGPHGDAGLTGRKIIVDTYGGFAPHGGGAFSGKDPTKVDRSASYMTRYIAKNIVAAGIAEECLLQISYAIGRASPTSIYVNTFNTGKLEDSSIQNIIVETFDLTPKGIIDTLDLKKPIYRDTTNFGHFGHYDYPWEKLDKVESLLKYSIR